jgi:SLOG in TRPM, prokaryote
MTAMGGPAIFRVADPADLDKALRDNAVQTEHPVLACVGGAAGVGEDDLAALAELLTVHVIPEVERRSTTIVDGGTDAGIMRLIGRARAASAASFQLVGVVAAGTVRLPDSPPPQLEDAADVEPNHTHIVVVPGDAWGDESPWLSDVADKLAGGMHSATLVVNGGSITLDDALTSVRAQRPVIVLADSGRAADEIAGVRMGQSARESAQAIADSPLTTIVSMRDPALVLAAIADVLRW